MTFTPTDEQVEAARLFRTGEPLVVRAGAGTGKTSTLRYMARNTMRDGLICAFNRAVVNDLKASFPSNVTASTMHGLAMRDVGIRYRHRLQSGRMKTSLIARLLGIDEPFNVPLDGEPKRLSPVAQAGIVSRMVDRYCQTADDDLSVRHMPYVEGLDLPTADGQRTWTNHRTVAVHLLPYAQAMWADLTSFEGRFRYDHGYYLKLWQLERPVLPWDFIMFDECQDADPVMLDVIQHQGDHAQVVYVGDDAQAIYEWRGAVNALDLADARNRCYLTQSFRFGPAIADAANMMLDRLGAELRLVGSPGIDSTIGKVRDPDALLCRTNAAAVAAAVAAQVEGRKVAIVGGANDLRDFVHAVIDLQAGQPTEHRELACFESWADVQFYADHDPLGHELSLFVKLADEWGPPALLDCLERTVAEQAAHLIVSTAHKAKGREWPTVALAGDFPFDPDGEHPEVAEEQRLLYVAVTRARLRLDPGPLAWLLAGRPAAPIGDDKRLVIHDAIDTTVTYPGGLTRA